MGFFHKKKNSDTSSSVLSESEIQKKLYGEFSEGSTHVVTGERDAFREPAPFAEPPQEPAEEKEPAADLFNTPRDIPVEPDLSPRRTFQEPRAEDPGPRYVPLHDFEKKPASQDPADPYARFRQHRPSQNRMAAATDLFRGVFEKGAELLRIFSDPKQVAVRRAFYWILAILVVFLLFWGVNALNSQREDAMRTRYQISGETAPAKVAVPEVVVIPSNPVAERPVVITPAPVRSPKTRPAEGVSATGPYVVQVVTYPTRQDADQVVSTFKRAGLRAFIKEDPRPSGRIFYLVLLGGFRTAADAQAQLTKFRAQEVARPFQDAFVKTNRS